MEGSRRADDLALAGLVRFFGVMLLAAGIGGILLGAYAFDNDRKARDAMEPAVAVITEAYVHGGAYYIAYEADGAHHEALLSYEGRPLAVGAQVPIRYDPAVYESVRADAPAAEPLLYLGVGGLLSVLGGAAVAGQSYLKGRGENPWAGE